MTGKVYKIDLTPTEELGYLCGLVMGDGYLYKAKSRNYTIGLETTDEELANAFVETVNHVFPQLSVCVNERKRKHGFSAKKSVIITTSSKMLYEALRPFKLPDYRWIIPSFIDTKDSLRGFIRGIFDTEGGVHKPIIHRIHPPRVYCYSKHKENLTEVKEILMELFGINGFWSSKRITTLYIGDINSVTLFYSEIGFGLPRKRLKLERYLCEYYGGEVYG
jgi:intein-encoded DNA endonuclease-like protein